MEGLLLRCCQDGHAETLLSFLGLHPKIAEEPGRALAGGVGV